MNKAFLTNGSISLCFYFGVVVEHPVSPRSSPPAWRLSGKNPHYHSIRVTSSPTLPSICPSLPADNKSTPRLFLNHHHQHGQQLLKNPLLQAEHRDPVAGRRLGNRWLSAPPGTCQRRSAGPEEVPRKVTTHNHYGLLFLIPPDEWLNLLIDTSGCDRAPQKHGFL